MKAMVFEVVVHNLDEDDSPDRVVADLVAALKWSGRQAEVEFLSEDEN